jgi:hypothetical protein
VRVRISWVFENSGAGGATTADVDGAARALADAVRAVYGADAAHVLLTVVAPLRAALVTDGRYAVERGRTWDYTAGAIHVTLSP